MKILAADDEYFVRYSLVNMLEEICTGDVCILEAENGEELIQTSVLEKPDLIFLDIRMPKLGGLEAFAALKDRLLETQWVIVSGYSDFSYARQAMHLGAKDYLMKPVNPEELKALMDRLSGERETAHRRRMKLFSADVNLWIHHARLSAELEEKCYTATVLFTEAADGGEENGLKHECAGLIQELCAAAGDGETMHGLIALPEGSPVFVSGRKREELPAESAVASKEESCCPAGGTEETLTADHERILRDFFDRLSGSGRCRLFQTGFCAGPEELEERLRELERYFSYAVFMEDKKPVGLCRLKKAEAMHPGMIRFCDVLWRMGEEYERADYGNFMACCEDAAQLSSEDGLKLSPAMKSSLSRYLEGIFPEGVYKNDKGMPDFKAIQREYGRKLLGKKSVPGSGNTVEKIIGYIRENYAQDISVSGTAEMFGFTPNYQSTIFKNETKMTFVQFVTNIRIRKARELLAQGETAVNAVAEAVGYKNAAYFTRVFKENTGVYPTEFRKAAQDGKLDSL